MTAATHRKHFFYFTLQRIFNQPLACILRKISLRLLSWALWLALLPLTLSLHIIGWRRATVFTDRIGHLAMEPDCLLKAQQLGLIPKRHWFILAPAHRVSNTHLLRYWKGYLRVYEHAIACFILGSMSRWVWMRHDVSDYLLATDKAQEAYAIYTQWGERPPLLKLSPEDCQYASTALRELGLPPNAWFVCVHAREGGFSPVDESLQSHRNSNILNTLPAIKAITERGGWVIRLGDPSMQHLPELPQVIDYAHHPRRSARLDIILCAKARFILGNTSGIALVGTVFGAPCAIANAIPVTTTWFGKSDLSLPKHIWSHALQRRLSFSEAMQDASAHFGYAKLFANAGLRVEENSPEEIQALCLKMLHQLGEEPAATSSPNDSTRLTNPSSLLI